MSSQLQNTTLLINAFKMCLTTPRLKRRTKLKLNKNPRNHARMKRAKKKNRHFWPSVGLDKKNSYFYEFLLFIGVENFDLQQERETKFEFWVVFHIINNKKAPTQLDKTRNIKVFRRTKNVWNSQIRLDHH